MVNGLSQGWKQIAHQVGRSERWCRYMAKRAKDPLPVFKIGGLVNMNTVAFDAWLERQKQPYKDSATVCQRCRTLLGTGT
jgi:hypothetical protein